MERKAEEYDATMIHAADMRKEITVYRTYISQLQSEIDSLLGELGRPASYGGITTFPPELQSARTNEGDDIEFEKDFANPNVKLNIQTSSSIV